MYMYIGTFDFAGIFTKWLNIVILKGVFWVGGYIPDFIPSLHNFPFFYIQNHETLHVHDKFNLFII